MLEDKEEQLRQSINHVWQLSIAFSCLVGTLNKLLEEELRRTQELKKLKDGLKKDESTENS